MTPRTIDEDGSPVNTPTNTKKEAATTPTTKGSASSDNDDVEQQAVIADADRKDIKSNLNKKFQETEEEEEAPVRCKRNLKIWCIFAAIVIMASLILVIVLLVYNPQLSTGEEEADDDMLFIPVAPTPPVAPLAPAPIAPPPAAAPTAVVTPGVPTTGTPTAAPVTNAPTVAPTQDFVTPLVDFLETSFGVSVSDDDSSARRAVDWLAQEQQQQQDGVEYNAKLAQRFTLLTLEFGMIGDDDSSPQERRLVRTQANQDECLWEGVACIDDVVTQIRWGSRGMSGSLASEIRLLTNLTYLEASNNELQGSIPEELYDLANLETLYLYKNQLTGTISSRIGNLDQLTHIHLSHNQLSGSIPTEFKSKGDVIRDLRYLNLYSNQLTGPIPDDLRWRRLFLLDLGRNQLTGTLPADIGEKFVSLRHLALNHNQFRGTIPASYTLVGNGRLESFHIDHNQLTGAVPSSYAFSNKLIALTVQENNFNQALDKETCKQSVFDGGEMVELKADCDICSCNSPFCDEC